MHTQIVSRVQVAVNCDDCGMLCTNFFGFLIEYAARGFPAVNTATKASVTFGMSLLVGAFKAFVLMLMWNWFVSPVFHG